MRSISTRTHLDPNRPNALTVAGRHESPSPRHHAHLRVSPRSAFLPSPAFLPSLLSPTATSNTQAAETIS